MSDPTRYTNFVEWMNRYDVYILNVHGMIIQPFLLQVGDSFITVSEPSIKCKIPFDLPQQIYDMYQNKYTLFKNKDKSTILTKEASELMLNLNQIFIFF